LYSLKPHTPVCTCPTLASPTHLILPSLYLIPWVAITPSTHHTLHKLYPHITLTLQPSLCPHSLIPHTPDWHSLHPQSQEYKGNLNCSGHFKDVALKNLPLEVDIFGWGSSRFFMLFDVKN